MVDEISERPRETVIITRDWQTDRILYKTPAGKAGYSFHFNDDIQWDGNGFARVTGDVMQNRLIQSQPNTGDVIEIDGYDYVVIERDMPTDSWRVLRESPEAHRLALWHLVYWTNLYARNWVTVAFWRIHRHQLADMEYLWLTV